MKVFFFKLKYVFISLSTLFITSVCSAQNYGLGFFSHEAHQDKRTSLNLSSEKEFHFSENFEVSFDLSFLENHNVYFGYIIRVIDNQKQNYDIVYNTQGDHFNIVIGDQLSASFDIPRAKLYNQWNKIRLQFNPAKSEITVIVNGTAHVKKNVQIKKSGNYQIVFGTNRLEPFETTDVPPMKIRDVKISEGQTLAYHWPLNEVSGAVAHDVIKKTGATVNNPHWQTALHGNWEKKKPITVNGMASVTFDQKGESLLIVAVDTIYTYSIANSKWSKAAVKGKIYLNQGNRSFFNPQNDKLYSYFPGSDTVLNYNNKRASWNGNFKSGEVTGYWHFNKMFSAKDTSLYVFGGYGYLLYKNSVQRYSFNAEKWIKVANKGDFFTPRYLAALGSTVDGDTAYILGGYGSSSGKQILSPKKLYDMMRYTVKDQKFTKMYELNVGKTDFALANSLVIDQKNSWYYGLIFDRNKYNSALQLMRGSLKDPSFQVLQSKIPYAFHDVHSFADLFYCPKSNQFIAVTLLRTDDDKTVVNVFTLMGPPYFSVDKLPEHTLAKWWYFGFVALLIVFTVIYYIRFVKGKSVKAPILEKHDTEMPVWLTHEDKNTLGEMELAGQNETGPKTTQYFKNAILLFGDLQVFDGKGNSVTKFFTPLIKELFLIILIHSVKLGRGMSSDKLNEIFWFDKTEKNARNNRSVAIAKLKSLLEKLDYCRLSKESGYWMIEIDYEHFYVDYHSYLNIIKNKKQLSNNEIQLLSSIIQRGNFLSTSEYEWLDNFKSEISNDIINTYLHFLQMPEHHNNPESLIEIASYILNIDPVNEEAMTLKCQAFVKLGKHSLAKSTFEHFVKAYKSMYNDNFDSDFSTVLDKVI